MNARVRRTVAHRRWRNFAGDERDTSSTRKNPADSFLGILKGLSLAQSSR